MNRVQNVYRRPGPHGWRERMIRNFGMDTSVPMRAGDLSMPNWIVWRPVVYFFIAMFACWAAFGYEPEFDLIAAAGFSIVLFFVAGSSISRSFNRTKEKKFLLSIYFVGFGARLAWMLYCYFDFNPAHFGTPMGEMSDVNWYVPFAQDIGRWISGSYDGTFSHILSEHSAAIDDTAYPLWLGIGYAIWGDMSDTFMPMLVKCIVNSFCAVLIYGVAKRHFGEGVGRMAAFFVALNPNMIYWCGNMFKEAEMVFVCCLFVNEVDKALSSNRFSFKALLPGLLAGFYLFFFRAALGIAAFMAVIGHIVFVSDRVLPFGKKIVAGVLVAALLLLGMGDSLRTKTEKIFETAQENKDQKANMEWRAEREHGNSFAKYASAAVFAPLIFTIPFPTFNQAESNQLLQVQLAGGSFIKNIFSFFVIMVMVLMLISGEWRRHVFILAYTLGYLMVLVLSNFAQSGRFHMPIMPMLMLFAAYGIQIAKGKPRFRRMFSVVLIVEVVACVLWNWFKLAGRGMI